MATYLGAFPFPNQAPSILTREAVIKVITLLTDRHKGVLKGGSQHRLKLLFGSLAVFDRRASEGALPPKAESEEGVGEALSNALKGVPGFSPGELPAQALDDDVEDDGDEDQLSLAALESMDTVEVINLPHQPKLRQSVIPSDNLLKLVELLLLIAPLDAQESVSQYILQLSEQGIRNLRRTANNILAAFDVENQPGIPYSSFKAVIASSLPNLFNPLSPLFEHFLSQESFDLSKREDSTAFTNSTASINPQASTSSDVTSISPEKKLPAPSLVPTGGSSGLLTDAVLSQLSFFIPPTDLFHRLNHLYSGSEHGFSMGSFEKYVFNWHGPTLLLVSGTLLSPTPHNSRERAFADSLLPRRFPSGPQPTTHDETAAARKVVYGALITQPWRQTSRSPFGDDSTLLFQLAPTHHVFHASTVSTDYISFMPSSPTTPHAGIGFGMKLQASRTTGHAGAVPLGPVSLYLDDALEFGCFTHTAAGGGSFGVSASAVRGNTNRLVDLATMQARRGSSGGNAPAVTPREGADWQDRFEIEALEVYGLGGKVEAERQRRALEFDENEARRRKEGGVSTGDHEADRELLMMAGIIGNHSSGGSMG